jgi:hypothetical protein
MTLLESIVAECGRQLQKKFFHIGEFSIDLGISKEGQYYIFECNSKPMVFDEPFIRKKGLTMLCRSLFEKAGFNFDGIN